MKDRESRTDRPQGLAAVPRRDDLRRSGVAPVGTPEEASRPFIQRALELGINFFDTADMYSTRRAARRSSAAR